MLNVTVIQPALPAYRVPVFERLSRISGIRLRVIYGKEPNLTNCTEVGFSSLASPQQVALSLGGRQLFWHGAQVSEAISGTSDVLILNWNANYLSLAPALAFARLRGIKTLLWGHGFSKRESGTRRRLRGAVATLADGVMFYDACTAKAWAETLRTTFVAPNALDQSPIRAAAKAWRDDGGRLKAFQKEHGLNGKSILLFVSRLLRSNGLDLLLDALPEIRRAVPNVMVVVVGDGPDRSRLVERVRSSGLADVVRIVGSIYGEVELAPWFLSATVFCYPENIGLSVLHAFGYAVPVITNSDRGSHGPEFVYIRDGWNGLLYRRGDVASLVEAVVRVCRDEDFRQCLAGNAEAVASEFDIDRMIDGIMHAIETVASQPLVERR